MKILEINHITQVQVSIEMACGWPCTWLVSRDWRGGKVIKKNCNYFVCNMFVMHLNIYFGPAWNTVIMYKKINVIIVTGVSINGYASTAGSASWEKNILCVYKGIVSELHRKYSCLFTERMLLCSVLHF